MYNQVCKYSALPYGWKIQKGANNPRGYVWIFNGKSRFDGEYQAGLLDVQALEKAKDNNESAYIGWSALSFPEANDDLNNSNRDLIAAYLEVFPNAKGYKSWRGIIDPAQTELCNFCFDIIFDGTPEVVEAIQNEKDALKCLELAKDANGEYLIWS